MMTIDGKLLLAQNGDRLQKQDRVDQNSEPDRDRLHDGSCEECDGECDGTGGLVVGMKKVVVMN